MRPERSLHRGPAGHLVVTSSMTRRMTRWRPLPDFIDPANGTFPSFDENGSIFANGVDPNPAAIMDLKFDPETSLNSGTFPSGPEDLQADHPVGLPRRQHDLPGHPP